MSVFKRDNVYKDVELVRQEIESAQVEMSPTDNESGSSQDIANSVLDATDSVIKSHV